MMEPTKIPVITAGFSLSEKARSMSIAPGMGAPKKDDVRNKGIHTMDKVGPYHPVISGLKKPPINGLISIRNWVYNPYLKRL